MLLQAAMVVLAMALQAPIEPPTPASVLPPDCEFSEEQLLVLAIPGYHERVARSNRRNEATWWDDFFEAWVAAAVKMRLGSSGCSFLIVAISEQFSPCDGCYQAILLAVDLDAREVAWRFESYSDECNIGRLFFDPDWNGPILRILPRSSAHPAPTVAFRYRYTGAGTDPIEERWFEPRFEPGGKLSLVEVWRGAVPEPQPSPSPHK